MSAWEKISHLSPNDYRRFALACCHRIEHLLVDRRLKKALKKLERFVREPENHQLLKDAHNTASSVYAELRGRATEMSAQAAAACTLFCATQSEPVPNLIGNFEHALEKADGLSPEESRKIKFELLAQLSVSRTDSDSTDIDPHRRR